MRAEIILVGDELLEDMGGVQPPYIGELLEELNSDLLERGYSLGRLSVVGDAPGELAPQLTDAHQRGVDLVVTIGGLGPTHDDRVRDGAAHAIGRGPPEVHPEAMGWLMDAYRDLGIPVPRRGDGWERMAHCPLGARPLRNPAGLACGLSFTLGDGTQVRCLPGVTYEALPMWREHVLQGLRTIEGGEERAEATWLVKGVREGVVAPVVETFMVDLPDLRAGVYLTDLVDGSFRAIRVTLRGSPEHVEAAAPELEAALASIEGGEVEMKGGGKDA